MFQTILNILYMPYFLRYSLLSSGGGGRESTYQQKRIGYTYLLALTWICLWAVYVTKILPYAFATVASQDSLELYKNLSHLNVRSKFLKTNKMPRYFNKDYGKYQQFLLY